MKAGWDDNAVTPVIHIQCGSSTTLARRGLLHTSLITAQRHRGTAGTHQLPLPYSSLDTPTTTCIFHPAMSQGQNPVMLPQGWEARW